MKLQVGERLPGTGPAQQPGGYVVTAVLSETPWFGLYAGKKILYNFDFSSKRVRETDEKEWLDVVLRTIHYPTLNDRDYVLRRRDLARGEVRKVLGRSVSNLLPEPIDLLELVNTRDAFAFPQAVGDLEPIVIHARPRGQLLGDWRQTERPVAATLAVLAELLSFIDTAHHEGILLNGMGPASILIDQAERVHYVGTETILPSGERATAGRASLPLFPAERLPRGFSPPEAFVNGHGADRRGDLYAWGALAYFLLTRESPAHLALDQGRSWVHFQESHFATLEKALRDVPKGHLSNWLEQLGLGERAGEVAESWPRNFVALMQQLLHPDPRRRPSSVGELRRWLMAPPPPLVAAVLAVRVAAGEARVLVDTAGIDGDLQIVMRRTMGQAPATPWDGAAIFDGPWPAAGKGDAKSKGVHDHQALAGDKPIFYGVFTRRQDKNETVFSQAATAQLVEPTASNLRRLAEAEARQLGGKEEVPALVRLLFQAFDVATVAGALFDSKLPVVRSWALRQLHKLRKTGLPDPALEELLWRGACDPAASLRRESAREILAHAEPTEELLERLAWTMGRDDFDEALHATQVLGSLGVAEDLVHRVAERVGEGRSQTCPICGEKLPARQRSEHLRSVHDFVVVDGSLSPRLEAMGRLWDKVLHEGNTQAHEQLLSLAANPASSSAPHPYVASLEQSLKNQSEAETAPLEKLIQSLRQSDSALPLLPCLLKANDARVADAAREVLLPRLGETLRGEATTPRDLHRALEQACPGPGLLEERILLCYRLPQVGVEEHAVSACAAQLQEERLIPCPECRADVPVRDLEAHLLGEHRIYQFRGVRLKRAAMKAGILDALCRSNADVPAGRMLELLAREHGEKADRRMVTWLCQRLRRFPKLERLGPLEGVAETLTAMGAGEKLLPLLMTPLKWAAGTWLSRCLALEIVARLPGPIAADIVDKIKPLLADRHFPPQSRKRAVVGLFRTTGKEGDAALALVQAFLAQSGKMRSLDKLRELEGLIGKSATLDALASRIADQVRMTCPRCGKQLRRKLMVTHLWDEHRLVLDGLRAREPWKLIEDWVVDYCLEKDPDLYHLCRDLSFQIDGEQGVFRLQKLMLRHGVDDPDARAAVFGKAQKQHATVCPKCYHLTPVPAVLKSTEPNFEGDEMDGAGYRLALSEQHPLPRLIVETAEESIHRGREPGRLLTRFGAVLLVVPIAILLVLILRLTTNLHPLALVGLCAGICLVLGGGVFAFWPSPPPVHDRLIDAAWGVLVPHLLEHTPSARETAFIGGLARASIGAGQADRRAAVLEECIGFFEQENDPTNLPIEAALLRLQAEDARSLGEDPMPILLKPLRACLAGKKPFTLADHLLTELTAAGETASSTRARAKMLLIDALFTAGFELSDLPDLAQAFPGLNAVLDVKNADVLVSLRYLTSLKAGKPWEKFGKAMTLYDLAGEFEQTEALLNRYPGLMLSSIGQPIFLTIRGVWCQDLCLPERPRTLEVRKLPAREGYQLILGKEHLWFATSPDDLAASLKGWLDYFFDEFMPGLESFSKKTRARGDGMKRLAGKNALTCPGCGRLLLPRPGELAVAVEG